MVDLVEESQAILLLVDVLTHISESQGPDLNRSVVDLQSTAWPLRHLGSRVDDTLFCRISYDLRFAQWISSGFNVVSTSVWTLVLPD